MHEKGKDMQDRKLTPDMVPVIKLARQQKYNYARIASYFEINQGRIADVMKGRRFPEIPPAKALPPDFPTA
jgi:predicted XRE-type DNA-binding protein